MKTGDKLELARLLLFACDLDSGRRKDLARATVKVAMEKEQRREQERVLGSKAHCAKAREQNSFP